MTFDHLQSVVEETQPLASRFVDAGFRLFLVGGIVRDQMLDLPLLPASDLDLTTDARPPEIKAVISGWADAVWDQGERFGTVGCTALGRHYEITTHRSEFYEPDSRKPAVAFSDDIVTDLSRRDFTVNAMALELPGGELFDPYGGATDLVDGVLRTPLPAAVSFGDDPLRMLRAARFVSGYDLEATTDVIGSMREMAARLEIVAVERRRDELDKLVMLDNPTRGLVLLEQTGVAEYALPSRPDLAAVGRRLTSLPARLPLRFAALLCDEPDRAAAELVDLRFSKEARRAVLRLLDGAALALSLDVDSDAAIRRLVLATGEDTADALLLAGTVDAASAHTVTRRLRELAAEEDLGSLEPALTGDEVMAVLGLEEGPEIGAAMTYLLDLRVDEGPLARDVAVSRLREWRAAQPRNSSTS